MDPFGFELSINHVLYVRLKITENNKIIYLTDGLSTTPKTAVSMDNEGRLPLSVLYCIINTNR